jgi:c-di-GMP-binding flagellar brake protein YcgR
MEPRDSERRRAARISVFLGAELETPEGRTTSAVSRDASATGLLLLTRANIDAGSVVKLHVVRMDQTAAPITVAGRVVRSEPLDEDERLVWTRKLAIALDDPPPELIEEMELFAQRQRELYQKP